MDPRRAKIGCTIGPASRDRLGELIAAGMDVARLNFSHGEHGEYARIVADIRQLARDQGRTVAILQDLQGPKIRTGRHVDGPLQLAAGQTFAIAGVAPSPSARAISALARSAGAASSIPHPPRPTRRFTPRAVASSAAR